MVDCGNTRCAQERRSLKRELLTWSKKVPVLVGLELVAAQIGGKDLVSELLEPLNQFELEAQDWEPKENCTYCDASTTVQNDPPRKTLVPSLDSNEHSGVRYSQHYLPYNYSASTLPELTQVYDESKPLDLSTSSAACSPLQQDDAETYSSGGKAGVELKVPKVFASKGKKKDGLRKAYTEGELHAAVSDIRCGKLGTRRAAVLYGIPRSTLRNKIFKLDSESPPPVPVVPSSSNGLSDSESPLCMSDIMQSSGAFCALPIMGCGVQEMVDESYPWLLAHSVASSWDHPDKLDLIRQKHNLCGGSERKFGSLPAAAKCGAFIDAESVPVSYLDQLRYPLLPELVRKLTHERVLQERKAADTDVSSFSPKRQSSKSPQPSKKPVAPPVELKIPSYKPMRAYSNGHSHPAPNTDDSDSNNVGSNHVGDALKNIIARSIAEKVRSRSLKGSCTDHGDFDGNASSSEPDSKRLKLENGVNSLKNSLEKRDKDGMKRTRPKRGQYRKYNSQLLVEAVKAVQRGEMSVHRAGSYFGVPHSTLEYKVKERHLLRQKKPREGKKKNSCGESSSTSTGSGGNSSSSNGSGSESGEGQGSPSGGGSPPSSTTPVPSSLSQAVSSSLGMPFPLSLAWSNQRASGSSPDSPTGSNSPYNFSLNTSASELLKKLQRKVQAKASLESSSDNMPNFLHSSPSKNEVVAQ